MTLNASLGQDNHADFIFPSSMMQFVYYSVNSLTQTLP